MDTLGYFHINLYNETETKYTLNREEIIFNNYAFLSASFQINNLKEVLNNKEKSRIWEKDIYKTDISQLGWNFTMFGLHGSNPLINTIINLEVYFDDYKYHLKLKVDKSYIYQTENLFNHIFLDAEIEEINKTLKKHLLDYIKQNIN